MRSMRCLVERESRIWCPLLGKYLIHRGVTICLPFKSFQGYIALAVQPLDPYIIITRI